MSCFQTRLQAYQLLFDVVFKCWPQINGDSSRRGILHACLALAHSIFDQRGEFFQALAQRSFAGVGFVLGGSCLGGRLSLYSLHQGFLYFVLEKQPAVVKRVTQLFGCF